MQGTCDKTETRQSIVIENQDQQIFGVLHRPLDTDNAPIVVIHHGFASSKHGSNRCYVHLAEALTKHGIAALRFDFRGSGDSEGSLEQIALGDLVSDSTAICRHLQDIEGIDPSRMGMFGASLGGTIAILSGTTQADLKALALWAPVASGELWYRDFLKQYPELANQDPSKVLGSYRGVALNAQFREQFSQMCAHKSIEKLSPLPILHMHGEKDSSISLAHQEAFRKAHLERARFITYPESDHSLGFAPCFKEVVQETAKWFKEQL